MRTIETRLYTFAELSEDAKQKAIDKCRDKGIGYPWSSEQEDTLNAFADLFNINIKNWQIDPWGHSFVDIESCEKTDVDELTGTRLYKFIVNRAYDTLFKRKYMSKSTINQGVTDEPRKRHPMVKSRQITTKCSNQGKWPHSAYANTIREGENCNLTGVCHDEDILKPVYDFLKAPDKTTTYLELMQECVDSWAKGYERDIEWYNSDECISEILEANGYEFEEDGKLH